MIEPDIVAAVGLQPEIVGLRPQPEQRLRYDEVEDRVTEKLEAFVVATVGASMCQGLNKQARIGKSIMQGPV